MISLQVKLPGTTCESLKALIAYVYTDELSPISNMKFQFISDLLCLANRLCLPHLIFLIGELKKPTKRVFDLKF